MPSPTSAKVPGTAVNATFEGTSGWAHQTFGNPLIDAVNASDNVYLRTNNPKAVGTSQVLRLTNFGFTTSDIPASSTITKVTVAIERKVNTGTINDNVIQLVNASAGNAGDRVGSNLATGTSWPGSDTVANYVFTGADLGSLTDSQVRSTAFGVDIRVTNDATGRADVDTVTITIEYTAGSSGTTITVSTGALTLTGQTVEVRRNRILSIAAGALSLTGQTVNVKSNTLRAVTAGALTLTGQTVTLIRNTRLLITAAVLVLAGQAVAVLRQTILSVTAGTLTLTGQTVTVLRNARVSITAGAMTLAGQTVNVIRNTVLAVTAASLTYAGQVVSLASGTIITVTAGALDYIGESVDIIRNRKVEITAGALSYAGQTLEVLRGRLITVTAAALGYVGRNVAVNILITVFRPPVQRLALAIRNAIG